MVNSKILIISGAPIRVIFQNSVTITHSPLLTKRELLQESSKLFDPIGIAMPVTIQAKILPNPEGVVTTH